MSQNGSSAIPGRNESECSNRERGRQTSRGSGRGNGRNNRYNKHQSGMNRNGAQLKRLFFGIELPESIRIKLGRLESEKVISTRTLPSDSYHITLHFLGDVEEKEIQKHVHSPSNISPFHLKIEGVGSFPNTADARTLWAGIEPSEQLIQLHASIKDMLVSGNIQVESRPYSPHITIAKRHFQKKNENNENNNNSQEITRTGTEDTKFTVERWLEEKRGCDGGDFQVKEFVLYESIPGLSKPVYVVRERYQLVGASVNQS